MIQNSFKNQVSNCQVVELPKFHNPAGSITHLNVGIDSPFEINLIYYLYDFPGGESRGGHGHKELVQFLIATSGSSDVLLL